MNSSINTGFLLTRSGQDRNGKIEIEYWLSTPVGPTKLYIADESTVFFVSKKNTEQVQSLLSAFDKTVWLKEVPLRLFSGDDVLAIYCRTINASFHARDLLKQNNIEVYESDFRPEDRYLMERFIKGSVAFSGSSKKLRSHLQYSSAKVKQSEYTPSLTALSLDIECSLHGELFSIGLAGDYYKEPVREVLMIGSPETANTKIIWVDDERSLLLKLCQRIAELDPDLIIGWNVINFDLRILASRAKYHGLSLKLGRGNSHAHWRQRRGDNQRGYISIPGRVAIDGIDALKSATWSFPSFSLESVAQTLLGRGKKVDGDVDDRVAEIVHNFKFNKPALAAYNLEDCVLVLDIFAHTNIIDYLVSRSQMTGLELDRSGGSVAAFTNLYLPKLHRSGYIAPNLPASGGLASPGGYVMQSIPGLYKNVLVLDFKSLYPSIIRTFKVDPMGMIEGLANPEQSLPGFKGAKFDRNKHFLPEIITELWQKRDQAKLANDSVRSQAIKIIMNSFYGVLGSGGCRFYDTRLASSITMRGHEIMQTTSKWISDSGYRVIYGDTDSTFVALDDTLGATECQKIGNELEQMINANWRSILQSDYQIDCHLEIEFETLYSRFLMPTIRGSEAGSKKRYAGLTVDSSNSEQIIFKGLETVRSDWTSLARSFQSTLFDLVFHDQDPSDFVRKTVKETLAGKRDAELVYRKQLRRKLAQYVKNVPPQVKAARLADDENHKWGKSLKYQNKGWISYVITVHGPEPIEYQRSPLDYDHYVEKQLKPIADGVLPFIDLDFENLVGKQRPLF